MNEQERFGRQKRHFVKFSIRCIMGEKEPENSSRAVIRRKAFVTFMICFGASLRKSLNCRNVKIIKYYFFKCPNSSLELHFLTFITSCKKMISAPHVFSSIRTIIVIFNFTIAFLIIPFAAFFLNSRIVYYFKFLTAIFNTKFVQRMWLCSQTACCA